MLFDRKGSENIVKDFYRDSVRKKVQKVEFGKDTVVDYNLCKCHSKYWKI